MNEQIKPNTGIVVLNVFLCIFASCLLIFSIIVMACRYVVTPTGIKHIITSSTFADEFVEDFASAVYIDPSYLDEDEKELYDDMTDLTSEVISDMVAFYITGEGEPLDVDNIMDFIEKHEDLMDVYGADPGDYLDEIEDELDDLNDEMIDELDEQYMSEDIELIREVFSTLYSPKLYIIPMGIAILFLGIVIGLFQNFLDKGFVYTGTTLITTGIIAGILSFTANLFALILDEPDMTDIVNVLMIMRNHQLLISAIVLALGIAFVVAGKSIRSNKDTSEMY